MSKYIDSEAFFKVINTLPYKDTSYPDTSVYNGAISDVADMLTHFPAADVQEVVRCKECVMWDGSFTLNGQKKCLNMTFCTDGDFYCGWGSKE